MNLKKQNITYFVYNSMKKILTLLSLILALNSYGQTVLDSLVFERINEYRVENGISTLTLDTSVYKAAYHHAKYLHDNGSSWGHREDSLVKPWNRLKAQGLFFWSCGENIATFTANLVSKDGWVDMEDLSKQVLTQWINSPSHHWLLLHEKPNRGAIAVYIDSGVVFVVLNVIEK